jgi:signal transduction histidine kinase
VAEDAPWFDVYTYGEFTHEAVRIKAEFLANVSHELRTPLNSIVNLPAALANEYTKIELLHCGRCDTDFQSDSDETAALCPQCDVPLELVNRVVCVGDPAEHLRFLRLLEQQGAHLLKLVEDVLDFSRLGSGRMELDFTNLSVTDLVEEVRATIEYSSKERRCAIVYEPVPENLALVADHVKLKQILINLIGNAVKFTPDDGEIRVKVEETRGKRGDRVVFSVKDTGIGIPEDQLEAVFESFRQVDGSHTRTHGGTGLGLAISRQLVEMHGGKIWVESEPGEGSEFKFWLPADQDNQVRSEVSLSPRVSAISTTPAPAVHRGFGRVVVIDDEPAHLAMARKLLEREGYKVQLVSESKAALEIIRRDPPRFVLLDIMMPEVNGLWILSQLKRDEATKELPVVVSTAFHYNRTKAVEAGGIWLPKPWSSAKLSAQNIERLM